jgi:hypothetical protein
VEDLCNVIGEAIECKVKERQPNIVVVQCSCPIKGRFIEMFLFLYQSAFNESITGKWKARFCARNWGDIVL